VNWARQEALSYRMALDQARDAGDQAAIAELKKIGGPPYPDTSADAIRTKYAGALTPAEERVFASLDPAVMAAVRTPPTDATYVARGIPLLDQRAQSMVTYDKLRRELAAFDARALGLTFGVPMLFFQGDRDAYTVTSEVVAYEDAIIAPKKMIVLIEGGGHSAVFLRDRFLTLLVDHVRLLAADTQRVR
jgi:pimeloyl-ACP methyl ester carboxylesterase